MRLVHCNYSICFRFWRSLVWLEYALLLVKLVNPQSRLASFFVKSKIELVFISLRQIDDPAVKRWKKEKYHMNGRIQKCLRKTAGSQKQQNSSHLLGDFQFFFHTKRLQKAPRFPRRSICKCISNVRNSRNILFPITHFISFALGRPLTIVSIYLWVRSQRTYVWSTLWQ